MDTLDRFITKEFLQYFIVVLFGAAILFLVLDFFTNFWSLKLSFGRALALYGYKLPAVLQQVLPVACLAATLLVLTGMSRQNEVLALYASGVGQLRLVTTFAALVIAISTVSFLLFDALVPPFQKRQQLLKQGLDPVGEQAMLLGTGGFWYRSGHMLYNVAKFLPKTSVLEDLNLFVLNPEFSVTEHIHAKSARFDGQDWIIEDGFSTTYSGAEHAFPTVTKFNLRRGIISEKPTDFRMLKSHDEMMALKDLRRYISRNRATGLDTTAEQVHYQERLAVVFTPLLFILVGIPFALKPLKNYSVPKSIAFCFAVVLLYLLVFRMSLSMGLGGNIPPLFAGWTPNVLMLGVAIYLFSKKS